MNASAYKIASVLLRYPTAALFDGLPLLREAVRGSARSSRDPFGIFLDWLSRTPSDQVARQYVENFDLRRQCTLYLSYYRYGDTRKRGMAMLTYTAAYRAAGFTPADGELPDYLPMVLEFADLDPRGEKLLRAHRADLELVLRALRDASSPYASVVEAVCACLPGLRRGDVAVVSRLREAGPPAEEVGLEPFAPPAYLAGSEVAQ